MLLGLEFIHTNNILHRDIKPENLVLDEKGTIVLFYIKAMLDSQILVSLKFIKKRIPQKLVGLPDICRLKSCARRIIQLQ
jgi:serine/threonine protein kinase